MTAVITGFNNIGVLTERLIQDTLNHLRWQQAGQFNRLSGAITDTATTITYTFIDIPLLPGRTVEIDDEILYIWTSDTTAMTAVVQRGFQGTTPAPHVDKSMMGIEPRFPRQQIVDVLRDEIEAWPTQLYGVLTWNGLMPRDQTFVNLSELDGYTGLRLLDVQADRGGEWVGDIRRPRLMGCSLEPAVGPSGFADGYALRWSGLDQRYREQFAPGTPALGTPMTVTVGAHFQTAALASGVDVGTMGLTRSMCDIPPIGAAARLLFPVEVDRTDATALTRSRTAADVPPNAAAQLAQTLIGWRNQRINEEIGRLTNDFGWSRQ